MQVQQKSNSSEQMENIDMPCLLVFVQCAYILKVSGAETLTPADACTDSTPFPTNK